MAIFEKRLIEMAGKNILRGPYLTLAHDDILTNGFLHVNRGARSADADRGVARVNRAMRARIIGIYLRCQF